MHPSIRRLTPAVVAAAVALIAPVSSAMAERYEARTDAGGVLFTEQAVTGLEHPWSLAFLPDGDMLVTERSGRLQWIAGDDYSLTPVDGVPAVAARGQGGLLDVVLGPDFSDDGEIFLSYAEAGEGGAGTAVARARLVRENGAARLDDVTVIFRQLPKVAGGVHFGSRIVVSPDKRLFVTLGERGQKPLAQDLSTHMGKVVRIERDGSIPADNPFVGQAGALPEIWSYGHRNPQGAALHPKTGELWTVEHGARGGDEINRPKAGVNHGWPIITYGVDYSGARIGIGTEAPGMAQPVHYWDPSIAPSGMAFYDGDLMPDWNGDIFVGALRGQVLVRLELDDAGNVVDEERLFEGDLGRIRDVRAGPDGALWLLTDHADGSLVRVAPEEAG
ncbi:MAG TPA: PQQ-dependent sugar dehydrogenase [Methylomirabilota bacterium]|nr:PQQ-dependent sugar dehydrogenase [Methylomirabilota bacterium]